MDEDNRYDLRGNMLEEGNLVALGLGSTFAGIGRIVRFTPKMVEVEVVSANWHYGAGLKFRRYAKDLVYVVGA
jgi:hypothetical protein